MMRPTLPSQSQSSRSRQSRVLVLLLLLSSAILLVLAYGGPTTEKVVPTLISTDERPVAGAIIDRHLKQTFHKIESDKVKVLLENQAVNPLVGRRILPAQWGEGVDMMPDRNDENVARDLDRSRGREQNYKLDHQIQGELQDEENIDRARAEYQAEYARQFVENARQNGWDVQLDENYVVISVRPLKKREANMPLFEPGNSGAR